MYTRSPLDLIRLSQQAINNVKDELRKKSTDCWETLIGWCTKANLKSKLRTSPDTLNREFEKKSNA